MAENPYDTKRTPGTKEFEVGNTSVEISPPTFEAFMKLQSWVRDHYKDKATESELEYFGTGYAIKCIETCTNKFIDETHALQVYLQSGGPSGEVVQAAIKLCSVNKKIQTETLEQLPTSSPEK